MNPLDAIYILGAVLGAPVWTRKPRQGWRERMGHVGQMLQNPVSTPPHGGEAPRPRILLHAVSVGEVNALRPLVPLLTPHAEVIVCTTTDTGLARALQLFGESAEPRCEVVRYPLDFSWAVRRFLNHARPTVVGLVELELWPNFLGECGRRGIPACVINGRLSERSFRGYRRWRRVVGPLMFGRLVHAAVQEREYADRFEALGARGVSVTGSMKWDSVPVADSGAPSEAARALGRAMGIDPDRPLIVGGSTGPGEEALLHAAVGACPEGVQLAVAPRKPERFAEAAGALPGCVRRSEVGQSPPRGASRFVLDTIGELGLLYQLADVVVVGRSFFDLYGSDPIEPIALGRPVVIGPAVSDFATIVRTFEASDAIVRAGRDDLPGVLAALMADPGRRAALAANGRACILAQRGAAARHASLLLGVAGRAPGAGS